MFWKQISALMKESSSCCDVMSVTEFMTESGLMKPKTRTSLDQTGRLDGTKKKGGIIGKTPRRTSERIKELKWGSKPTWVTEMLTFQLQKKKKKRKGTCNSALFHKTQQIIKTFNGSEIQLHNKHILISSSWTSTTWSKYQTNKPLIYVAGFLPDSDVMSNISSKAAFLTALVRPKVHQKHLVFVSNSLPVNMTQLWRNTNSRKTEHCQEPCIIFPAMISS